MKKAVFIDEIDARFILEKRPDVARELAGLQRPTQQPSAESWGQLEERAHKQGLVGVVVQARQRGETEARAAELLEEAIAERAAAKDAVELAVKHGVVA